MRLDKWLKVSRLIKRRTVTPAACRRPGTPRFFIGSGRVNRPCAKVLAAPKRLSAAPAADWPRRALFRKEFSHAT